MVSPDGNFVVTNLSFIKVMRISLFRLSFFLSFTLVPLLGQSGEGVLIRFTEVRSQLIKPSVQLPGTVESRLVSTVAGEISGLVESFRAREGQVVKQGQVLAQLRRTSLELRLRAAVAQLKEDAARQKLAERTLERARELSEGGVYSQQQLDDALFEFSAWQGRLERLTAEIEQFQHNIEQTTIRAPYDGVVVRENTQVGEWLEAGGAVVELLSLEQLEVSLDLPERYFAGLRMKTPVRISFESLPGVEFDGQVQSIIPRADPQARTFPIKLSLSNPQGRIAVGMLARVTLPIGEPYMGTLVPKDAVVTQGTQQFVFLLSEDDSVGRTAVRTGVGVGQWVQVEGPLQSGDKVVIRGNERLQDGQKVRAEQLEYPLP
ncbi:MAG: efflux RND transporter periplasmic adaptor subunit [Acidobacteria bacterium]|nr:efflux RND transporter periplasmic adaptor subunit [Acidobacteriota bacterium]